MKVFAAMGSSRPGSNSSLLLKECLRGVTESLPGAEIREVKLDTKKIGFCTGCGQCKKQPVRRCVIQDDMQKFYPLLEEADVLIFSTPLYWWNISGQLKVFIDRLEGSQTKKLRGKRVILFVTGEDEVDGDGYDIVETWAKSVFGYLGANLTVHRAMGSRKEYAIQSDADALAAAYSLGASLTKIK